jgi:hypothetical protein
MRCARLAMDAECNICLGRLLPCQEVMQSVCHPISHISHVNCHNDHSKCNEGRLARCPVCRWFDISERNWFEFAEIFDFNGDALESIADISAPAQRFIEDWQNGTVTNAEKEMALAAAAWGLV